MIQSDMILYFIMWSAEGGPKNLPPNKFFFLVIVIINVYHFDRYD